MTVQMGNGLSAVTPVVDNEPVARLRDAEKRGDPGSFEKEMPDQALIVVGSDGDPWDGLLWDDEHVDRRLWIDVMKRQHTIVLVNDPCGYLFRNDFFKNGLGHGSAESLFQSRTWRAFNNDLDRERFSGDWTTPKSRSNGNPTQFQ